MASLLDCLQRLARALYWPCGNPRLIIPTTCTSAGLACLQHCVSFLRSLIWYAPRRDMSSGPKRVINCQSACHALAIKVRAQSGGHCADFATILLTSTRLTHYADRSAGHRLIECEKLPPHTLLAELFSPAFAMRREAWRVCKSGVGALIKPEICSYQHEVFSLQFSPPIWECKDWPRGAEIVVCSKAKLATLVLVLEPTSSRRRQLYTFINISTRNWAQALLFRRILHLLIYKREILLLSAPLLSHFR